MTIADALFGFGWLLISVGLMMRAMWPSCPSCGRRRPRRARRQAAPPSWIEHVNGDPTDNRIENLRLVAAGTKSAPAAQLGGESPDGAGR